MRHSVSEKLTALLLCALMLIGTAGGVFAEEETAKDGTAGSLVTVSDSLTFISYESYLSKYPDREEARASSTVTVDATEYDEAGTDAEVEVQELLGVKCLYTPSTGNVTWRFNIEEEGFYTLNLDYCAVTKKTADIERIFYIDGKVPFKESRYIAMTKTWTYDYQTDGSEGRDGVFAKDGGGNEMRPDAVCESVWMNYEMTDSDGYYTTPFEFYLTAGEHTLTLESIREEAAIASFTFKPYEALPTYEEVKAEYEAKGYKEVENAEAIHLNAETPAAVSHYTIYPAADESSAITEPQSPNKTVLNSLGGEKWATNGQWVRYSFTVSESGLYTIAPRFKQSLKEGIFVSRSVKIDGEIPFEEAKAIRFSYGKGWQIAPLSDNDGNPYLFYFEAGTHTMEFEVSLGDMSTIIQQANAIMTSINNDYLAITKLTGQEPDVNRDYGFARVMPETIADLSYQYQNLNLVIRMISATSGTKSQLTGTLTTLAELLRKMGSDESKIASNLSELQEQISSLGDWINEMTAQSLELDYILIQPSDASLPKAEANFGQSFIFEIRKFFASFFTDYDSIALEDDGEGGYAGELTVWTSAGREQAIIMNNLIANGFTKETNVAVNLKLVTSGTLLPAILAGTAPDVSLDASSPIDFAIRGAVLPLNEYDTFDEVCTRFSDSALIPLTLYGETYAIPTTQSVPVMFYRTDILADLGLSVPETWDDIMAMIPILQFNNMGVGIHADITTYIYQNGGDFYKEEGMSSGFDLTETLDAFTDYCEMFTQYSLSVDFNSLNRFRTGDMPIIIEAYSLYNSIVVSAPEIAGLWEMALCPGIKNDDGRVNHTVVAASSGIMMPKSVRNKELAWDLIDWYTDKECQIDYSNEMVALLGPSAKTTPANLEAFEQQAWSASEFKILKESIENSVAVPSYPGDYMTTRNINFAFNAVITEGTEPADTLLEYVSSTNKELTRKRKEFHLMQSDEWKAVKEYTGLETFTDWREWAKANSVDSYEDWMKDNGISTDNFEKWQDAVDDGETALSYKEWVGANN